MKKVVSLLLCAVLLLSFAACSNKTELTNDETTSPTTTPNANPVDADVAATRVMTIGDHTVMVPEYNFYYMTSYGQFMSSYGDYASMFGLDITKPFDTQACSMMEEGSTWDDYFSTQAEQQILFTMAYNDKAKAENMTLDEANRKAIQEHLDGVAPFAEENDMTEEEYYTKCFGQGMTKQLYQEIIERYYLAVQWQNLQKQRIDKTDYTDTEIETYYTENENQFAVADYRKFTFTSAATNAEDETDEQRAEYLAQTKKDAQAMAQKIKTEKDFIALSLENAPEDKKDAYKEDDATLTKDASDLGESDALSAWLFDKTRKANDVTVIEETTGTSVVMAITPAHKDETPYINVRHILIMTDAQGETPTDEEKAKAKEEAQQIFDSWKAGEATEESFAALANEKSEDPGSNTNGGLYKNVAPGKMVEEFNDWCFDASRKPGDTGLVETTYGCHIMYFSGPGEPAWKSAVIEALNNNAVTEFFDEVNKPYSAQTDDSGMKIAKQVLAAVEK